ncbi:MAG: hypothetical protein LUF81_05780 [Clostridiales bacterium]|nr:hypothetical protein [Clostridiales bacterium]
MSNKTYSRPDFTMMRFALSDNVADTSCDQYNKVTIPCLITDSHDLFNSASICGTGNVYSELGSSIVKVTETLYFDSTMDALNYLIDMLDGTQDGTYRTGSTALQAGEYLVWTTSSNNRTTTHAAYITTSVSSGINASA